MQPRNITSVITARPATDGAGVKINRLSGFSEALNMDPFLMLDEIRSDTKGDFIAGFPPHPHRGFETITYMLVGSFTHEDSMGNTGTIDAGGAQWMTAGSGVIHSEMPKADADRIHGFQFWLNLPASEKMQTPAYRDIQSSEIVSFGHGAACIRLIAGEIHIDRNRFSGTVTDKTTKALIADVSLTAASDISLNIDKELHLQFYVYRGSVCVEDKTVTTGRLAYLGEGGQLTLQSNEDSGLLLFGGKPINEPVAHHGPFVMNTQQEIQQAIMDYQNGTLAG